MINNSNNTNEQTKRTEEYEIANGETCVSTGDHLVLIAQADETRRVLELFESGREK